MKIIAFTSLLLAASASAAGHESNEDSVHDAKAKSSKRECSACNTIN